MPKPAPKPAAPRELGDEDALFLAAMGGRRKAGPLAPDSRIEEPPAPQAPIEQEDFTEAMATLKGMKPVAASKLPAPSAPTPPRTAGTRTASRRIPPEVLPSAPGGEEVQPEPAPLDPPPDPAGGGHGHRGGWHPWICAGIPPWMPWSG